MQAQHTLEADQRFSGAPHWAQARGDVGSEFMTRCK
jgi:hypothetical protein